MLQVIHANELDIENSKLLNYEVDFNLIHRITEDENAFVIQSTDKNLIAAQNEGRQMWIWINPNSDDKYVDKSISELYEIIKDRQVPSILGYKKYIQKLADTISINKSIHYQIDMGMIAYHCTKVIPTYKSNGKMIISNENHVDTIAKFAKGFIKDGFGIDVTVGSQLESAKRLASSGNTYLLELNNKIVSMANIAHRSKRHGRINNVYTPDEERNKGYASTLVANLSLKLLDENLTPMLYADDSNSISNKVYTNIGYIETGRIYNIKFIQ